MKLHINITSIDYIQIDKHKTKCIIRWKNPLTGNIQRSIGIAKCNPNDKFDSVLGDRIAESRAKINMWNTYNFSIDTIVKDTLDRHFNFIVHEERHLHDLINDVKTN